jgi:hypothetical protein
MTPDQKPARGSLSAVLSDARRSFSLEDRPNEELNADDHVGFAAILFCRSCGSAVVDINHWLDNTFKAAVLKCYDCGTEGALTGFTAGRTIQNRVASRVLAEARRDAARLPRRLGGRYDWPGDEGWR